MNITLITGNKGKKAEWQRLLPSSYNLSIHDLDLEEIQTLSSEEIVKDKVLKAYKLLNCPVMVEDVSAGLDSLGGLPGPFIKFFIEKLGEDALYKLAKKDRQAATVSCTAAYYDGKELIVVEGVVKGSVVLARGPNGFGFDKGFIPNGCSKTYGEMTFQEKDKVSHRSKAALALVDALGSI